MRSFVVVLVLTSTAAADTPPPIRHHAIGQEYAVSLVVTDVRKGEEAIRTELDGTLRVKAIGATSTTLDLHLARSELSLKADGSWKTSKVGAFKDVDVVIEVSDSDVDVKTTNTKLPLTMLEMLAGDVCQPRTSQVWTYETTSTGVRAHQRSKTTGWTCDSDLAADDAFAGTRTGAFANGDNVQKYAWSARRTAGPASPALKVKPTSAKPIATVPAPAYQVAGQRKSVNGPYYYILVKHPLDNAELVALAHVLRTKQGVGDYEICDDDAQLSALVTWETNRKKGDYVLPKDIAVWSAAHCLLTVNARQDRTAVNTYRPGEEGKELTSFK